MDRGHRVALLIELADITEVMTPEDVATMAPRANPLQWQADAQNAFLAVARRFDPMVENFSDLDSDVPPVSSSTWA